VGACDTWQWTAVNMGSRGGRSALLIPSIGHRRRGAIHSIERRSLGSDRLLVRRLSVDLLQDQQQGLRQESAHTAAGGGSLCT